MDNIRSLFKHNIFFKTIREDGEIHKTGFHKTDVTHNPERYGIMGYHDIKRKIKPFLYYLASNYMCRSGEYNNISRHKAIIEVGVILRNSYQYAELNKTWVHTFEHEQDLNFRTYEFAGRDIPALNKPFEICVDVRWEYILNEINEPNESESEDDEAEEDEDTTPVAISKPFHYDQCVVCLSKKPELLFVNCLHRCVCIECEETNPFRRCPSCRTHISIKVKI